MSRYVDLEGLTWDGTTVASKIQEVKTQHGYMSAITIGWLWGDNVPHIDLDKYEEQIRVDERKKVFDEVEHLYRDWLYSEYGMKTDRDNLTIRVIKHLKERKI